MRRILSVILVVAVSGGVPVLAQAQTESSASPLQESVARAARHLSEQSANGQRGPMSPAYKWTGIGLLAGGGLYFLLGAAYGDSCGSIYGSTYCVDSGVNTFLYTLGAALAGAGAVVLFVGNQKRSPDLVPTVGVSPGGIAIRSRISFPPFAK